MSNFYKKHLFLCTNQKDSGKKCCAQADAEAMAKHAKDRLKDLKQHGPGECRVSKSGCLGRCAEGPIAVVYPDGVWYTYQNSDDIDAIIDEHLLNDRIVTRLLLPS